MSHWAEINSSGKVLRVIVADQEFIDSNVIPNATWVQTSYNISGGVYYLEDGTPAENQEEYINDDYPERKRKNFAIIGGTYLEELDMFIPPPPRGKNGKKWDSWEINESTGIWEPPVAYPSDSEDNNEYDWNEADQQWDLREE